MNGYRFAAAALGAVAFSSQGVASAAEPHDARPTNWHEAARTASLLSAPAPERRVAVCVVDTGVTMTPDLEVPVVSRGADDGGTPDDVASGGHGTHVASFIAAQVNGWGMAGTWPEARIVSVRVFPEGGGGARAEAYARALDQCRQHPDVKVVNLSLAGPEGTEEEVRELRSRIRLLRETRDINVVVAAGNAGGSVEMPADAPAAFTVAAVDPNGSWCAFSARGPEVDVVAPGCGLEGASRDGKQAVFAGTSFAAPQVSALLAALRSYAGLDAAESERIVIESARSTPPGRMVDGEASMRAAGLGSLVVRHGAETPPPPTQTFVDYPRPIGRARLLRNGRKIRVRLTNRPDEASVDLDSRGFSAERRSSGFTIRRPRRARWIRLRYISDDGVGRWRKFHLDRPRGR